MDASAARLQAVKALVARLTQDAQRPVELLAVSKAQPAAAIRAVYAAGQRRFAENYLQEAIPKIAALADLAIEWHFIGAIQSNKTREVAQAFDWVHSIDRAKIARRLAAARPAGRPPLDVCIQVNVSGETTKGGVAPADVAPLAGLVAGLPRMKLRGLMTIARETPDEAAQRAQFRQLHDLLVQLNGAGFGLDMLSMGMSQDFHAAILEGATMVRIGSAIFGARPGKAAAAGDGGEVCR